MANTKIDDLTLAETLLGTMQIETDIGGITPNKISLDQLVSFVLGESGSDDIANNSDVVGATISNALETLDAAIDTLSGSLADVATSGSYADLTDTPTIPGNLYDLGDVDAGVETPSDGDILVYRDASGAFVLEAKPAGSGDGVDFISGLIESPTDKDYNLVINLPFGGTINSSTTICTSGTATARLYIGGVPVGTTTNSVSSAEQTRTHTSANTFSAGDDIILVITSTSSCVDMAFTVKYTRS